MFDVVIEGQKLGVFLLILCVDRVQLFVDRMQFLVRALELLVRGDELLSLVAWSSSFALSPAPRR
jgi:hypothetical protein